MIHPLHGMQGVRCVGQTSRAGRAFSYVDLEERVPTNHPLRLIRRIVDALAGLDAGSMRFHQGRSALARA